MHYLIHMETGSIIAFMYSNNIVGYSIFVKSRMEILISTDSPDSNECDFIKSLVYKMNCELLIVSLNLEKSRYDSIKETGTKVQIVEKKTFKEKKLKNFHEKNSVLSLKALNALLCYLEKHFIEFINISTKSFIPIEENLSQNTDKTCVLRDNTHRVENSKRLKFKSSIDTFSSTRSESYSSVHASHGSFQKTKSKNSNLDKYNLRNNENKKTKYCDSVMSRKNKNDTKSIICSFSNSSIKKVHGGTYLGNLGDIKIIFTTFSEFMYVDMQTIKSLNLLDIKKHPNISIKSKTAPQCLFSMLNTCQTSRGTQRIKQWMFFPLINHEKIEERRSFVEYILKNDLLDDFTTLLKKCKRIENNEKRFKKATMWSYFNNILQFLNAGLDLVSHFPHNEKFGNLAESQSQIIEVIGSSLQKDYIVRQGFHMNLDELRRIYENLPDYLNEIALKVSKEYNLDVSIVYFPQMGYLIETASTCEKLELKFNIGELNYFKNQFMYRLDLELGDIINKISDMEMHVCYELKEKLNKQKELIENLQNLITYIDCYCSLARLAKKYNMSKPVLLKSSQNKIFCKNFTNFMILQNIQSYQPITITLEKTTLVTGHNASGKSSFLKNIGLAVILNQMGSYLPSTYAELTVFDKIFTKMCSVESIMGKKSAFLSDVIQIGNIFKFATEYSLVLCDEFGKGTNVYDGVSLLVSIILNLHYPLSVFTTHFQDFFNKKILDILINVDFLTFKNFIISKGIAAESNITEMLTKMDFDKEFISELMQLRNYKDTKIDDLENRNDEWAIKIINDFVAENINENM
ncbi:hypothetical protein EDEG_02514 [Edhazardia aedis USNM 41457]|uniref:DNA mismatch repair proteins mutS family domain-containing protein n=1 Tax=Edhazardia aedis (strain USNM 41457) TaxID=1003232 RepID=J9D5R2_EDHAE|nr:hypothetical protein EDEG_02514 [Edhazardia aedis USNM 41457]|eukprot:EJW03106.1 hypothetical protein EDEG_02514 [Edhazardia aedis USNM 41457]